MTLSIYSFVTRQEIREHFNEHSHKHSLAIQFADFHFFGRYSQGTSVALIGAPFSATRYILNQITDIRPYYIEESDKSASAEYDYISLNEENQRWGVSQETFDHLMKIVNCASEQLFLIPILCSERFFDSSVLSARHLYEKDKNRAKEIAQFLRPAFLDFFINLKRPSPIDLLIKKVAKRSFELKNTVFEWSEPIPKELWPKSTLKVFVYHPLREYVRHVNLVVRALIAATEDCVKIEIDLDLLIKYASLLRPREWDDEGKDVVGQISPKIISDCFFKYYVDCFSILCKRDREKIEEFKQTENRRKLELLNAFGFDETTPLDRKIDLVPRDHYDLVLKINTSHLNYRDQAKDFAQKILDRFPHCTQSPNWLVRRRRSHRS